MREPFNKVLVYQYGKVGSSTITHNGIGQYYPIPRLYYYHYIIQTHSHDVAKDILNKYSNVLVINIVRLPIDKNLSNFWECINRHCPYYKEKDITYLNNLYNSLSYSVQYTDKWMEKFFETTDIDISNFKFDIDNKFTTFKKNNNTFLFFRFEDWDFIKENTLPKFNIVIKNNYNEGKNKHYKEKYAKHKEIYKVSEKEESLIRDSKIMKLFYTQNEIDEHINKWSK
ncbi:MAG: hypothetical protein CMF62_03710 [Magnetococcales bacterium]|nr:hypothetical protein [Magnetococcales bacterium]|tara:strand:+ start:5464 stop:6144 length:681 start_codon:yes stop_codon:yes gene_type:complete